MIHTMNPLKSAKKKKKKKRPLNREEVSRMNSKDVAKMRFPGLAIQGMLICFL